MTEYSSGSEVELRAQAKIDQIIWSDKDAQIVASFLKGEAHPAPSPNISNLWEVIGNNIALEDDEAALLLLKTKHILDLSQPLLNQNATARTDPDDDPSVDEYMYSSKKRAQTAASLVGQLLRKAGITEGTELLRVVGHGGRRGKKDQSSFSQGTKRGQDVFNQGYIATNEGGPHIVNAIYAPHYEGTKRRSDVRQRGSLAHELVHSVRALSNDSYWQDQRSEAGNYNLPTTKEGKFHVGSHSTGSEAVAELFEAAVRFNSATGNEPTIRDVFPQIAARLQDTTTSDSVDPKYLTARFALFHHLGQLIEFGAGDVSAYKLVALGAYGYTSFEKAPELIQLGLATLEKQASMEQIIVGLKDWLVSKSEAGFIPNS